LPEHWQAENKAAAEVIVGILEREGSEVDLSDAETYDRVGEEIHTAWVERNSWQRGAVIKDREGNPVLNKQGEEVRYGDAFAKLPEVEQEKDISQMRTAQKIFMVGIESGIETEGSIEIGGEEISAETISAKGAAAINKVRLMEGDEGESLTDKESEFEFDGSPEARPDNVEELGEESSEKLAENTSERGGTIEELEVSNSDREFINMLEEHGISYAIRNIDEFEGLGSEAAISILEKDSSRLRGSSYLLRHFEELSQEVADKMIEAGSVWTVAGCLDNFGNLNQETAYKIIKEGHGGYVLDKLDKFDGLSSDHDVIDLFIAAGRGSNVAERLEMFEGLDHKELVDKLIEAGDGQGIAYSLEKFEGIDHQELVDKLLESGDGKNIARYLEKFEGIDHQELVDKLVEGGHNWNIVRNLEKFKGINYQGLASKMIERGDIDAVAEHLKKFEELSLDIAHQLIEAGKEWSVAGSLEKFKGLNHQDLADRLVEKGSARRIVFNLEKFEGLDNLQEIVDKTIENGDAWAIAKYLGKIKGLNRKKLAKRLIKMGYERAVNESLGDVESWEEQGPWERRIAKQNKKVRRGPGDGTIQDAARSSLRNVPSMRFLSDAADFWSDSF